MKVIRNKVEQFNPITIELETVAEAEMLWHMLNCSAHMSLEEYVEKYDTSYPDYEISFLLIKQKKMELWKRLDQVFTPNKVLKSI